MKKNTKIIIIIVVVIILLVAVCPFIWYAVATAPVSKQSSKAEVEIPLGTACSDIASILKEKGIIKSEFAFKLYTKFNKVTNFQAGVYELDKNMNVAQITEMLQTGMVLDQDHIRITFVEGKTIRWIANKIAEETNHTEEEVFTLLEDDEYIDSLVQEYWFLTDEIKQKDIYYPLEGYLFPDTYEFEDRDVKIEEIFKAMLIQMGKKLDPYSEKIEESGHTVHELLTIASIIETESLFEKDRKDVASVLYNRLEKKMSLGSDVTTYYAVKIEVGERDLYQKELDSKNPYNTRGPSMEGKLPIGPISSVGTASIEAAIEPNKTDYYYFVADKNGKVYFTKTNQEHSSKIDELQASGLWYEF